MGKVRLENGNGARLERVLLALKRLPELEAARWRGQIKQKLATGPRARDVVSGEWGTTEPSDGEAEWDLEVANWLDGIYSAVADRTQEVYERGKAGLGTAVREGGSAVSSAGFGLWPLAIAAVAVMLAFSSAKRSR